MERSIVTIRPRPPYDFELTGAYATYFRGQYGAESFQEGVFRRLLDCRGRLCLVVVRSTGSMNSPLLEVEIEASGARLEADILTDVRRQVAWILGAEQDLVSFYRMATHDSVIAPLIRGLRGLHIPHTASVFEALVLAILGQQISAHVARVVRTLLIATYGPSAEVSGVTYYAFPRPEAIAAAGVAGLRAIKFSARKAEYVADIAAKVSSGMLNLEGLRERPDEEIVHALNGIRGVGPWTTQWLFIRALGRTDGFPHGDLALQRLMGILLNKGTPLSPEEALEYSHRWSPFRSYITTYLFAATRSGRFGGLSRAGQVGP
jgi:3-methyladenine DNA glycosylase/8-oxoguanine DNA glycosylase